MAKRSHNHANSNVRADAGRARRDGNCAVPAGGISRATAVNTLRGFGLFRNVSLRLLSDLAECSGVDVRAPQGFGKLVELANAASFSLHRSLDLKHWAPSFKRPKYHAHLLYVCERPELNAPLEGFVQLLAASVARDFKEPVALVTPTDASSAETTAKLAIWKNGHFVEHEGSTAGFKTQAAIIDELPPAPDHQLYHLFFVHPGPGTFNRALHGKGFHRIIYVTDSPPDRLPPGMEAFLVKGARPKHKGDDPYFCSFIPSIIVNRSTPSASPLATLTASVTPLLGDTADGFETEVIDDGFAPSPSPPGRRLRRDLCRLHFDLQDCRTAVFDKWPDYRETASHWARAVTNRQLGLALSGGGASSYRTVPFIRMLHEAKVPIDIVSGISGGSLIGAYYCHRGLKGLELCVEQGKVLTGYVLTAVLNLKFFQLKVDGDLKGDRVEHLERRFVALTTALPKDHAPEGSVVIKGTLGEAVRASGSASVGFSRTRINQTRFADGAAATMVPARVLKDYGADFVIACNSIPGPKLSDPAAGIQHWPLRWAAELAVACVPFVGRIVDFAVTAAYLVQEASRAVKEDAHVYVEVPPDVIPFIDSVEFWKAHNLAKLDRATRTSMGPKVTECQQRWHQFKAAPCGTDE